MGYPLLGTRETWVVPTVPLATTVLPSHAPRPTLPAPRRDQRGQVVRRPSPAGYCLTPTAELPRILQGPITPTDPPLLVCHRMDDTDWEFRAIFDREGGAT